MGRRHMAREGGECPFRLSHIITLTLSPCDGPFILLCLWTGLRHLAGTQMKP